MCCCYYRQRFLALLLLLVVVVLLVAPEGAHAQRAAVSLGARLKNRLNRKSAAANSNGADIIQGEQPAIYSLWDDNGRLKPGFAATAVTTLLLMAVGYSYVFKISKKQQRTDEEVDDVVVDHDHVVTRAGLEHVDLAMEGLKLTLKRKKETKQILDGSIRVRAQPGRLLAIMGPSGAGKSTVLHAWAGKIKYSSKLTLEGNRYMNGVPLSSDSTVPAAFIEQDVMFFPHMTVRETLAFRVELKLGALLSKSARDEMVDDLMSELGLTKTANTVVGDSKVRGISGGERKRLSIAVEMISSPSVLMLDEPTSGLDSSSATNLVSTLRDLADSGKTVIAVIHQPSQHVFAKFDDVLLLSEGKQMYFGPRQDIRAYMEAYGCQALPEMGTAEHILDCVSSLPIEDETEEEAHARIERLARKAREASPTIRPVTTSKAMKRYKGKSGRGPKANVLRQFRLLFKRSIREVFRGKVTIVLKLVQQFTTAIIYGGIYSLGTNQASIQDRFGLLSLIAIGSANLAMAQTIRAFPREKAIVSNELASHLYRTLPYFIGKAISELPMVGLLNSVFGVIVYQLTGLSRTYGKLRNFLGLLTLHGVLAQATGLVVGAISPNSDVALAMFPAIIVLNIIFDGKNISEENTPKLFRWIPKVGLIRWGFEGLCVNEFAGLEFDAGGPRRGPVAKTGADALARFGLGARSLRDVVRAQFSIAAGCWLLSYLGLTLTRQRFLAMKPVNGHSSNNSGKEE